MGLSPLAQLSVGEPTTYVHEWVKLSGDEEKLPGLLDKEITSTAVSKPTVEVLTWTTMRLREYKNVNVDRIMKVGIFKLVLYKKVVSPRPECFHTSLT